MRNSQPRFVFLLTCVFFLGTFTGYATASDPATFCYSPPEWQAAICLPDDPCKSLVDKSGALLYHYHQGGREFGTRVWVEVSGDAVWRSQGLDNPRVPIVKTCRSADGLQIVEEAFAVTHLSQPEHQTAALLRLDDGGGLNRWARPAAGIDPSLQNIAVHFGGSIRFAAPVASGESRCIALALCEGWWGEAGQRVQTMRVEGAEPVTVDTVAGLGKNQTGVFWFDARDVNSDGRIDISIDAADRAGDKNTILNGLWVFDAAVKADSEALLAGRLTPKARATMAGATPGGPARNDVILVRVTNTTDQPKTVQPVLVVDTALPFQERLADSCVVVNNHETVTASLAMSSIEKAAKTRRSVKLAEVTIAPGQTAGFCVVYCGGGVIVREPKTFERAVTCRDEAVAYWQQAPLPFDRVRVPDPKIQSLFDSAARNIWQAREIKKGLPAFQVGPTCYRGLWIVDGAFLLEAATILGAGDQARAGVEYTLGFQQPDGRFEILRNYHKENGIVIWTCVRHARLTQDRAWLESVWPKLERTAAYIKQLREQTERNDSPLDDGLIPPGFPDGGLGGTRYEYTNVYWNLVGLRAFVQAARWLGRDEQAGQWQREYDDFLAAFRKAARRDMQRDTHGNAYLPIVMGAPGLKELPQRAQWAFCHAVYPGQVFDKDDPLVAGNMAMLKATEREGMVYGTGWDASGIWNYFASFYGHAWLWQGDGRKAAQVLDAFGNHASPVLDWREEQSLQGEPYKKVGDMPHNWASAEFIRLTVHLLALDRGNELHLFEGLPAAWTKPGLVTKLDGIATPFGALTVELRVAADGKSAHLHAEPLSDPSCEKVVVHLAGWASPDAAAAIDLDPNHVHDREIPLNR